MKLTFQEVEAQVSDLKKDLKKVAKQYEEAQTECDRLDKEN